MQQLQLIWDRQANTKQEITEIKDTIKTALANSSSYQTSVYEWKEAVDKKRKIENAIKDDFSSELAKLDTLKADLENDKMLLSDMALSELVKGNQIEIVDKNGVKYNPEFLVSFKRK